MGARHSYSMPNNTKFITPLGNSRHRIAQRSISQTVHIRHRASLLSKAAGETDVEVAVFRFTLGIPGFDDALIPRVVGFLCGGLLILNHALSEQTVSAPQARTEILGALLVAVAIAAPTLQRRLEEAQPGRGRQATSTDIAGAFRAFSFDTGLPATVQQELAWGSYALLKNCNACGVFFIWAGKALLCRGMLGDVISPDASDPPSRRKAKVLDKASLAWGALLAGGFAATQTDVEYLEDRSAIERRGFGGCGLIPKGAGSMVLLPLKPLESTVGTGAHLKRESDSPLNPGSGVMVLVSERQRAFSAKELRWAQGVAATIHNALCRQ